MRSTSRHPVTPVRSTPRDAVSVFCSAGRFNDSTASDGAFNIYTPTQTHFIIDLSGYFAP